MSSIHLPAERQASVDIASIVQRVLDELKRMETKKTEPETKKGSDPFYEFRHRVVTLSDLETAPAATKTIQIPAGGVLTPSVRDELRTRGIAVIRSSEKPATKDSNRVGSSAVRYVSLRHDQTVSEARNSGNVFESVQKQLTSRGVSHCDQARNSVVMTFRPATAMQQSIGRGVVTAMISRVSDVARFQNEIQPTCYVLDLHHLNLMSTVNAIVQIAHSKSGTAS